ncbi:serine/threonine-protein kinase [Novipirellula artificiosorum]|uniref:non-specific serine/threonine protein kinase n=1 Tax=Novipirellula artificiosorum TaxID=2528016 RepID=A0A5C6E1G0_9BACT|nr:serine/threonine-protein kinase [Novipirellula artificiosorum]TWU41827.1 Serine/threonine-protein kinase PrkC [Novipirellula artificiosorum]
MKPKSRSESNPPITLPADHESSLLEVVMAEYVEKHEKGEAPDARLYLDAYPQFAEELKSFFRNHHWLLGDPASQIESNSLIGVRVGPYEIESEIARGGMGVVYRARQDNLGRPVALKLISSGVLAGEEERQRFRIEAEAAARLRHPGIIAIHDIGSWGGYEYFSMSLIEGPTLQQQLDERRHDDASAARIVGEIARAVAYAHREGIIHRDLKPENILIGEDGRPLVADFGLAKWHRDGATLTRTGQVLGTPHYMSPEQATGCRSVGQPADIYSLGAILYAVLTGRPPHDGRSSADVLRSVLHDEPLSPRMLRRSIPTDLEVICLKAMHYDPAMRYATADDLADDLDRFLLGEPIRAAGSGILDRMAREIRRDQHQDDFRSWGRTLIGIGIIIFVTHVAIFFLDRLSFSTLSAYWIPRATMLASIFASIYWSRHGQILPRTVAERPVWSIWLGYLATLATMNVLLHLGGLDEQLLFPFAAALGGFGFIAMGGHVWGGSALLGLLFLSCAVVSVVWLPLAPLFFGLIWLVSLVVLGWHYRSQATADDLS